MVRLKISITGGEGNVLLKRKLQSFSGGEQRLLWFFTVSLFPEVDMLMLDKPTNHMDKNLQKVITRAIHDFQGAVMLSTHDVTLLDEILKSVGIKVGSTITSKNYVLEKKDGRTSISLSTQSPKEYMYDRLAVVQNKAKRFKPNM